MAYALGKFANGLCDRCDFEYTLHEIKEEWNGLEVCSTCYEPKHPQLEPLTVQADTETLHKPRPNNHTGTELRKRSLHYSTSNSR